MPRFDGGMVNLGELIRTMAESLMNEIMDARAEEACADGGRRNGYRERALVMSVGEIRLRIPRLRMGSYFPEDSDSLSPGPCKPRGGAPVQRPVLVERPMPDLVQPFLH